MLSKRVVDKIGVYATDENKRLAEGRVFIHEGGRRGDLLLKAVGAVTVRLWAFF